MRAIQILTADFEPLGEIANYTSLTITRRHFGTGELELHVPIGARYADKLWIDRLLIPAGAPQKAAIVKTIIYEEAKQAITVKACTLDGITKGLLAVPPPESENTFGWDRVTGDAETVFKHFAANNLTNPPDAKRAIPRMTIAPNQHRGMAGVPWQARFEALDVVLRELGEYTDMGWSVTADTDAKRFVFDVVPGRDLQVGNPSGTHAIISLEMGNASEMKHTIDGSAVYNTAYVGGYGEDERRFILAVENGFAGLERREVWVDGGSLELPEELLTAGRRKLDQSAIKETIQGAVQQRGAFVYGRDWDLGDRVTLQTRTGRTDARVIEVRETYEPDKPARVDATFGSAPVSLSGILRGIQNTTVR